MQLASKEYFGRLLKSRKLGDFYLSVTSYDCHQLPFHIHENPYISINLGGVYQETSESSKHHISTGEIIARPSFYYHENTFLNTRGVCFNLEFLNTDKPGCTSYFDEVSTRRFDLGFYKVILGFINNYKADELDCLIRESLAAQSEDKVIKKQEWYFKVLDLVNSEYEASLTIQSIANAVNIHPNYLARRFKLINGLTLGEYIRKVRVERGFIEVSTGKKKFTDIALQLGFYDQSHFIRTCRYTFGMSPGQIRKLFKELN